ncbi:helix-turn-helix domain-containing protein [Candidatus Kaiserbacteria bacterium]|nr:helix-turn-helix domain-containing protein [Candidatus Kaiserbacteria bacterium]
MKKKLNQISEQQKIETLDMLYTAASAVKGRDATKAFLHELLTPSERIMLGRRIWIARLLLQGYSQAEIGEKLEVGPNTIWRVQKWLDDQMPGYREAVKGLELELEKRSKSDSAPFSFNKLKKKYPMHFLLFPTKGK